MSRFVLRLLDLMRFRAGPQDLPPGWPVAVAVTLAYLLQGLLADRLLGNAGGEPGDLPRSLVAVTVQILATAMLLRARGLGARLPQSVTALTGAGFGFGLLSTLLVLQAEPGQTQPWLALLWLGVFLWSLMVDGHIYRFALSTTMRLGMLVAVLIFALNFLIMGALFPGKS